LGCHSFFFVIPAPYQVRDKLQQESRPVPAKARNHLKNFLDTRFRGYDRLVVDDEFISFLPHGVNTNIGSILL
jgi:hypothetical protein